MIQKISAKVIKGYGIASGKSGGERFPGGTIFMQKGFFLEQGLDLNDFFQGTLNIDISPNSYEIIKPKYFFEKVNWTNKLPPENFFFFDVEAIFQAEKFTGYIYMPDPATKVDYFQGKTTLELILPKIESIKYGDEIEIKIQSDQLQFLAQ